MWTAILDRPLVTELGAGTLDESSPRCWFRQHHVYPVESLEDLLGETDRRVDPVPERVADRFRSEV